MAKVFTQFYVGASAKFMIAYSNDSGISWTTKTKPSYIGRCFATSDDTLYAFGTGTGYDGKIYSSSNLGDTWELYGNASAAVSASDLIFKNNNFLVAAGRITTNNGTSWVSASGSVLAVTSTKIYTTAGYNVKSCDSTGTILFSKENAFGGSFTKGVYGLSVAEGGGNNGLDLIYGQSSTEKLYLSKDSGQNFSEITLPSYLNPANGQFTAFGQIRKVFAFNTTKGIALSDGAIAYTTDGGTNWTSKKVSLTSGSSFEDFWGVSWNECYIVEYKAGTADAYKLWKIDLEALINGSASWSVLVGSGTSVFKDSNNNYTTNLRMSSIYVPPTNYAPTDISLSFYNIVENAGANAVVGIFSAADTENNVSSYSLVAGAGSTHNSLFNIFQNGNAWQLRANSSFDYENMPAGADGKSLSIRVQATDSGGLTYSKALVINITNDTEDDPVVLPAFISAINGRVMIKIAKNPSVVEVFLNNGQALSNGSVVRNTSVGANNQKFFKITGDSKTYKIITIAPPAAWKWNSDGEAAWAMLQDI